MPEATYIISDLHLSPDTTAQNHLFGAFLEAIRGDSEVRRLIINGDFVEYWFGRKQLNEPFYRELLQRLKTLVEAGIEVVFVAGNRDFLLTKDVALFDLEGETTLRRFALNDENLLVTHGDQYCLEDIGYLRFRKVLRALPLHALGRMMPAFMGRGVAAKLRRDSEARRHRTQSRARSYFDIKDEAVQPEFARHQVDTIICGHIHEPQERHYAAVNGPQRRLLVLGDWGEESAVIARKVGASSVGLCLVTQEGISPWPHEIKSGMGMSATEPAASSAP